jgi:hypothetical protein
MIGGVNDIYELFKKGRRSKTEDVAKGELKYLLTNSEGRGQDWRARDFRW